MLTLVFLTALAVASLATPVVRSAGRRLGLIDQPNERSSHLIPTPRTGGYAVLAGVIVGISFGMRTLDQRACMIIAAAALIAVVGGIDDRRHLSQGPKFVSQCVAAAIVMFAGGLIVRDLGAYGLELDSVLIAVPLTLLWLVGYTNAFNFMDGVNGIASAHAIVAGGVLAALAARHGDSGGAVLGLAIAGGAAGFLPWNLPFGSIFMGDIGSATLGFLLASLVVRHSLVHGGAFLPALLPLTPFILDPAITFARRVVNRERVFSAHRTHFYQRLNQSGWSHARVSSLWTLLALVSAVPAIVWEDLGEASRAGAAGLVVLLHLIVFLWIHWREKQGQSELREE